MDTTNTERKMQAYFGPVYATHADGRECKIRVSYCHSTKPTFETMIGTERRYGHPSRNGVTAKNGWKIDPNMKGGWYTMRRFITEQQLDALLWQYRLTAVGYPVVEGDAPNGVNPFSRYGRILRAVRSYERANGRLPGAYKDLDACLGQECGRILA